LKSVFLFVIIKIPKSSKRWSIEKKRERKSIEKMRKEKRKAPRVSANKMGKSIF
jgi:hypothetical protein